MTVTITLTDPLGIDVDPYPGAGDIGGDLVAPVLDLYVDPYPRDIVAPGDGDVEAAPAELGTLSFPVPAVLSLRKALVSPEDEAQIGSARPLFTVAVYRTDSTSAVITAEVQLSGSIAFTSPTSYTAFVPNAAVSIVNVAATADLDPTSGYFWRARLIVNGTANPWTSTRRFIIYPEGANARLAVTWRAVSGTPAPHVWYASPGAVQAGTTVTVYGQGLPDNPTVRIGGIAATGAALTHAPANTAAAHYDLNAGTYVDTRTLTDTEHDEVTFTVPDVPPPGGPLTVEG